ncbi:small G protein signaling modulator 1-like [Scleropages formosus]|uniref:Small G protein signaling modulator 1-like n=1 Tax=Scleropages formosus TaxID=113540 RepID=A0A0N8K053_SCLFO|nr:small G protein signaling modulator 1-like [Scleropages formosus]
MVVIIEMTLLMSVFDVQPADTLNSVLCNTVTHSAVDLEVCFQVKQIMEEAVTRKFVHEDSSHIVSFCAAVEACILHGLKRRAAGFLRSNKIAALFTKVGKSFAPAEELCRKAQELEQIIENKRNQVPLNHESSRKLPKVPNIPPQAIKHLWVRTALMEKVLDKIVLYLVENSSKFYEKEAVLMDPVDGPILASLLVGPCALEYTKMKTADHFWTDPSADELVQRHRIHSSHCRQDSPTKRPALCIQKRHSSSSMDERPSPSPSARDYVESLHQNSRATLLFGKNNVLVQPRDDMEAIPGYLSLHQTADVMTLKWTPNQLMNGSVGDLDYERSVYWDYAMTIRLEEIVYLHCHQQVDSGGTVVLVSQDGIQRPPLRFPKGGHLLQFLSCLENGLLPHGQLDPPLWSQRGKGKVFPKLRKRCLQGSSESTSDKEEDEATDYVFRILFPGSQSEFGKHLHASRSSRHVSCFCPCPYFSVYLPSLVLINFPFHVAPLKLLCDNMKYQIISRAFYGWLAYCRHLSTVRTHLSALVNHTIVEPDVPCDASSGLSLDVWQQFLQDSTVSNTPEAASLRMLNATFHQQAYEEQELLRLVYFGGVDPSLRKEVWPFLLGHYQFGMSEAERKEVDDQVRACYEQTMSEWLGCEAIVRQREKEQHAVALAKCSSGASVDSSVQRMMHRDSTVSNEVFESVEEVDQIETEPKADETKQVPKIPNGTLPNGTSSPDSGHPSSRNFSVTSGLSDRSLSTEDSVALQQPGPGKPEQPADDNPAAGTGSKPQAQLLTRKQEAKAIKGNGTKAVKKEEVKAPETDSKDTETEVKAPERQDGAGPDTADAAVSETAESKSSKTEETGAPETQMAKETVYSEPKEPDKASQVQEDEEENKAAELKELKAVEETKAQGIKEVDKKEKGSVSEMKENEMKFLEINITQGFGTGATRGLSTTETCTVLAAEEALLATDSDESPSAIEMEEIPVAKVSMSPWDKKAPSESTGDSLSALADSVGASPVLEEVAVGPAGLPVLELRLEEEGGKPNSEGSGSAHSEEPEMESLFPQFDSLAVGGEAKNEAASPVSSIGTTYSQELLDMYTINLHRIEKDVQRCDRNYWYFTPANLEKLRNIMCSYVWQHLEIGYVQGMCDLLAPLLVILDDEAMAFSCFTELMKRMNQNFPHGGAMDTHFANMRSLIQILDSELFELMHQNGDYTHFYFCYRWFLLDFKRELVYDDVFSVWETIWAARFVSSSHFVLFIALALVELYRDIILENNMDFTDIIKFFNVPHSHSHPGNNLPMLKLEFVSPGLTEMAEHHNVQQVLTLARDLVCKVQRLIENK